MHGGTARLRAFPLSEFLYMLHRWTFSFAFLIVLTCVTACESDSDEQERGLDHIDKHIDHFGEQFEPADGVPTNQLSNATFYESDADRSAPPIQRLLSV